MPRMSPAGMLFYIDLASSAVGLGAMLYVLPSAYFTTIRFPVFAKVDAGPRWASCSFRI